MNRRALAALALATLGLAPAARAQRHDIRGLLSQSGLDFIAGLVPRYVPTHLSPPPLSKTVLCVEATQRNTEIDLHIDHFSLTIPRPGRLHLDLTLTAWGGGELFAKDVVACVGDLTCQDTFHVNGVRALVDLDVALTDGRPAVSLAAVDVQLAAHDFGLAFSGCFAGDLLTWVIDFAKQRIVDAVVAEIEAAAAAQIAPGIEELMVGLGYSGAIGSIDFAAVLDQLDVTADGVALGATVDLSSMAPADQCVAELDPGAPADLPGAVPDLAAGPPAHLALAANLGVLNDALYHVWREGYMCLDGSELGALGIELPVEELGKLLPGFPVGTAIRLELFLEEPIGVIGAADGGAGLTVALRGLEVAVIGARPDGSEVRLDGTVSASATAVVGIDPASNALTGQLVSATIEQLEFDQIYASEYGLDASRLRQVIEGFVLPRVMDEMGQIPLTGPVVSAGGFAAILRHLATTDAYLWLKADLFAIPTDDFDAPDTSLVRYPQGVVSPADAVVQVSGIDARIPVELLQYQVLVDGVARAPSFIREIKVGEAGVSKTYDVSVAAADLSGNVDLTPATVQVMVDGVAPDLVLAGDRIRNQKNGPVEMAWSVDDDLTEPGSIGLRLEIYEVPDPSDLLSARHLETRVLPPGTLQTTLEDMSGDRLYRIELHATDQAGNDASQNLLIDLRSEGGCAAGGTGGGLGGLLIGLAILIARRRR